MNASSTGLAEAPIYRPRFNAVRTRLKGTAVHTAWRGIRGRRVASHYVADLGNVKTYCLFIGHARSAHSIVGALLDAHPRAIVSDELDALRYVRAGFTRAQVMALSIAISKDQADRLRRKDGREGRTYSYYVPGQWQGRWEQLDVLGDSNAGGTVQQLDADPALLERTESLVAPARVRFIHVVRDPFDNISTMMIRGGRTFDGAFERYFANCRALTVLRPRIGLDRIFTLRHEDLIADPESRLRQACEFLGLSASPQYLSAAASILYRSPSHSRASVKWTEPLIRRVEDEIQRYDFLAGYRFDSSDNPVGRVTGGV